MSIRIGEHTMISDQTVHYAHRSNLPTNPPGGWLVSWLPGRPLSRNQAITAMTLAEAVVTMQDEGALHDHWLWPHVDNWARELDLTGPDAMVRVIDETNVVSERLRDELAKAGVIVRRINAGAAERRS